jgi:putative transposase
MPRLEDRQILTADIIEAHGAGARLAPACTLAGIDLRTLQRWRGEDGGVLADRRPDAVRPTSPQALSDAERARIVAVANEPRFADMPPARIVPMLADEGVYLGSEASFHRVLRAHGQMQRRGRARPPRRCGPPSTHIATGSNQVWCCDVTFLPSRVQGCWFYLYLILDLYSRKIVGFEVHDTDQAEHAPRLRAAPPWPRGCTPASSARCCTATTAPPSRPRVCSPCCNGWASRRRIRAHG